MASSGNKTELIVSLSRRFRQYSFPPLGSPIGGTQDRTGTFQGHVGQDLPQFTEPGDPLGHPERGPVKFVAAVFRLAAVKVREMLLVAGKQLHTQVFSGITQLLQTLV